MDDFYFIDPNTRCNNFTSTGKTEQKQKTKETLKSSSQEVCVTAHLPTDPR